MHLNEVSSETRTVTATALITCIYLPTIVTAVSYTDRLYSIGKRSSSLILVLMLVAEFLKTAYLSRSYAGDSRRRGKLPRRSNDIIKCIALCLSANIFYFIAVILFGGPALEHHEETAMLSTLLTILTVFPLAQYSGMESCVQLLSGVKSSAGDSASAMLLRNATLSVGGAWLGAVVIPLDWNRPWQVWPIPCYLGALGGFLLGNVLTIVHNLTSIKFPI